MQIQEQPLLSSPDTNYFKTSMERKPCPDAVTGQSTAAEVSHEAKKLREIRWVKLTKSKRRPNPVCAKVSHSALKGSKC